MGVLAIWRYPVKAMLGELLEAVVVVQVPRRGEPRGEDELGHLQQTVGLLGGQLADGDEVEVQIGAPS